VSTVYRHRTDGTLRTCERFDVGVQPWPAGVRETTREHPRARHELVVKGHPLGGIFIEDGEWIVRASSREFVDVVYGDESFQHWYEPAEAP
jgi:hypothetical protein